MIHPFRGATGPNPGIAATTTPKLRHRREAHIDAHHPIANRLTALLATQPERSAVEAFARLERDEGAGQPALYAAFIHVLVNEPDDSPAVDLLTDTLDLIHSGPWAKGRGLFPDNLDELEQAAHASNVRLIVSKADFEATDAILALSDEHITPLIPHLLSWLQDLNWPVARSILPRLRSLGTRAVPAIRRVLRNDDEVWKYWCINHLADHLTHLVGPLRIEIERIATSPTEAEIAEEVDQAAQEWMTRQSPQDRP